MTRVVLHPDADAEVIAAAEWYEKQQFGLGGENLRLHSSELKSHQKSSA